MKRKAVQVSTSEYPEALLKFFKDTPVYDSSC